MQMLLFGKYLLYTVLNKPVIKMEMESWARLLSYPLVTIITSLVSICSLTIRLLVPYSLVSVLSTL